MTYRCSLPHDFDLRLSDLDKLEDQATQTQITSLGLSFQLVVIKGMITEQLNRSWTKQPAYVNYLPIKKKPE